MQKLSRIYRVVVLLILGTTFFLTFNYNIFGLVNEEWFDDYQTHSEGLVLSRAILAEENGVFYSAGLNGMYKVPGQTEGHMMYQLEIYLSGESPKASDYLEYHSQNGVQGTLIALGSKAYNGSREHFLIWVRAITSLLCAICMAFFILWIIENIGVGEGIFATLMILMSGWLIVMGNNIFFQMWSFYLPVLMVLNSSAISEIPKYLWSEWKVVVVCGVALLIKCLISGYEFISAECIMVLATVLFVGTREGWGYQGLIQRTFAAGIGIVSGIVASLSLLALQIAVAKDSFSKALYTVKWTFFKRTYAQPEEYPTSLRLGLEGSLGDTLMHYLTYPIFQPFFHGNKIVDSTAEGLNMLHVISAALVLTAIWFIRRERRTSASSSALTTKAVVIWFWISLLAPLSWFVIFKSHAFSHPHLDMFTWYLPTLLIFPILLGNILAALMHKKPVVTRAH